MITTNAVVVVRQVHVVVPVAVTVEVLILFFVLPQRGAMMSDLGSIGNQILKQQFYK